jgi:hypothetical protein
VCSRLDAITTMAGINNILEEHSRMKRLVDPMQGSDDGTSEIGADVQQERDNVEPLLVPIGHYVGAVYHDGARGVRRQVRRGATFHDLTDDQFAIWSAAHGTQEAVQAKVAWRRRSVEEHPQVAGLAGANALIDEMLDIGLLAEVTPGGDEVLEFARSYRLVPLMLGLGNSTDDADMFDIGFLHQPVLSVSYPIYDLWQWSTMDDSVWATCESAADVAERSGYTHPEYVDPSRLLTGLLRSLHALLVARAAYLDIGVRLNWPEVAAADTSPGRTRETADYVHSGEPLILPIGHYLGAHRPQSGADADFHIVRVGWETHRLEGNDHLAVWALAHGLPATSSDEESSWTRSAIEGAARVGGIPNVATTLFDLISRDLLVEVSAGTAEAVAFAQAYRTRSLLVGLGNTAEEPTLYGLGASESAPPAIKVPLFAYELWTWGHACDSLWHACHVLAAAGDPTDPDRTDPRHVLTRCLSAIRLLLACGAIYLDEAREDVVEDELPSTGPSRA